MNIVKILINISSAFRIHIGQDMQFSYIIYLIINEYNFIVNRRQNETKCYLN